MFSVFATTTLAGARCSCFSLRPAVADVFLRALELYARYPCFIYPDKTTPVEQGRSLHHILIPDPTVTSPTKIKRPAEVELPLSRAKLSWWRVNPHTLTEAGYQPLSLPEITPNQ